MRKLLANNRETIWVGSIDERTQVMAHITIRLIETHLLELFDNDIALHFKSLVTKCEGKHAVAFEPKRSFGIVGGQHIIKIGKVVACPRIVPPSGILYCSIKIRNIGRAAKHQMFKQMGKSGHLGIFITSTDIIQYI